MNKFKFFSSFLIVLLCFLNSFSQENKPEKAAIEKLIQESTRYYHETNYDKALELSKQALINSFALNDDFCVAKSYNRIGTIFSECAEPKKALEYYNKAFKYAAKINNDKLKCCICGNLGRVYYCNDIDVNKGIRYYRKAAFYSQKIKDTVQIGFDKLNLAGAYFAAKKFDLGIRCINDVKDQVLKNENEEAKLILFSVMGDYYEGINNPDLAEQNFLTALKIAEGNGYESYLVNIFESLKNHYVNVKEPQKVSYYNDKYNNLYAKVYSTSKLKNLKNEVTQIESNEYKSQLEKIEKLNEEHLQNLKKSKIIEFLFITVLIILLLLLLALYKNVKLREKTNYELTKANEALKIAKERAEEASQLKTQFVSTITHELRTPLYGVIGITNIILDEHKELGNSPHLRSLKFSAKYLLSLVNDILQINKIEENRIVLEKLIFNLTDEITTISNAVEYIADKNNDKLIVEIDTAIPEFLIGDKLRLSQIVMNLVSNALKFTKNGKVTLSADLKNIENNIYFIEFKVKDTGIGIAKENQEKIFDKFVQIERKEDDYQGTGLGLSIVSKLVELFDSKISVESEVNVGTTFTFTIGFEYDEEKSQDIINNIEVDLSSSDLCNILVVEDNKINQVVTKKIIQGSNMTCTIVDDGYAALVALDRETFDIILMDINMPLINGFDTTRKIREKGITIPIVALTAFDKQEVTEEALSAGMNDIIVKPFEPSKLCQVVNNQVRKTKNAV